MHQVEDLIKVRKQHEMTQLLQACDTGVLTVEAAGAAHSDSQVSVAELITQILESGRASRLFALNLTDRVLGLKDIQALEKLLRDSSSKLIDLDFFECQFNFKQSQEDENAFIELIKAMQTHPKLRAISFENCTLSQNILIDLARMLEKNATLLKVSLKCVPEVGYTFGKLLLKSLGENKTLVSLQMDCTTLTDSSISENKKINKKVEQKIDTNCRLFLTNFEQDPFFLKNFSVPISSEFLSYVSRFNIMHNLSDKVALAVNPLSFIVSKTKQEDPGLLLHAKGNSENLSTSGSPKRLDRESCIITSENAGDLQDPKQSSAIRTKIQKLDIK